MSERGQLILDGDIKSDLSGIAYVRHSRSPKVCSGVLLTSDLVLTAKHCLFESGPEGDVPLDVDGLQIGFGPNVESLSYRSVASVAWIGTDSVAETVRLGQDVATLRLSEPAPDSEQLHDVSLRLTPHDGQAVMLAGYGISDLRTWSAGERLSGRARIDGWEATTGIVQTNGRAGCFGDSGGPVLSEDARQVLGVIGQVAGAADSYFCEIGLTFAATTANANVSRFLAKECAQVGGCMIRAVGTVDVQDASVPRLLDSAVLFDDETDDSAIERDDASVNNTRGAKKSSGCTLRREPAPRLIWDQVLLTVVLLLLIRRASKRSVVRE